MTSAREALRLRARGIRRVRPLLGGFPEWRARGYPVEPRAETKAEEELMLNVA